MQTRHRRCRRRSRHAGRPCGRPPPALPPQKRVRGEEPLLVRLGARHQPGGEQRRTGDRGDGGQCGGHAPAPRRTLGLGHAGRTPPSVRRSSSPSSAAIAALIPSRTSSRTRRRSRLRPRAPPPRARKVSTVSIVPGSFPPLGPGGEGTGEVPVDLAAPVAHRGAQLVVGGLEGRVGVAAGLDVLQGQVHPAGLGDVPGDRGLDRTGPRGDGGAFGGGFGGEPPRQPLRHPGAFDPGHARRGRGRAGACAGPSPHGRRSSGSLLASARPAAANRASSPSASTGLVRAARSAPNWRTRSAARSSVEPAQPARLAGRGLAVTGTGPASSRPETNSSQDRPNAAASASSASPRAGGSLAEPALGPPSRPVVLGVGRSAACCHSAAHTRPKATASGAVFGVDQGEQRPSGEPGLVLLAEEPRRPARSGLRSASSRSGPPVTSDHRSRACVRRGRRPSAGGGGLARGRGRGRTVRAEPAQGERGEGAPARDSMPPPSCGQPPGGVASSRASAAQLSSFSRPSGRRARRTPPGRRPRLSTALTRCLCTLARRSGPSSASSRSVSTTSTSGPVRRARRWPQHQFVHGERRGRGRDPRLPLLAPGQLGGPSHGGAARSSTARRLPGP